MKRGKKPVILKTSQDLQSAKRKLWKYQPTQVHHYHYSEESPSPTQRYHSGCGEQRKIHERTQQRTEKVSLHQDINRFLLSTVIFSRQHYSANSARPFTSPMINPSYGQKRATWHMSSNIP